MNNKNLWALLLPVVLLATQFAMLGTVSATTTALSGRNDFAYGVSVHPSRGYEEYTKPYDTVLEAEALGATLIRTGTESDAYDKAFASLADEHGMNVMFHMSLGSALKDGSIIKTPAQVGYDAFQAIYDSFYAKATALQDYDAYIQISNELDNEYKISGRTGTESSHYNSVQSLAIAIYLANKAVDDANTANGSNIKTVLNFAFYHYGFFDALKAVKINPSTYTTQSSSSGAVYADWDIIGWDYYSNMYDDTTYQNILPTVKSKYSSKSIIVCESNLTPESKNGNGTINYAENVSWLENFVRYCYSDSKVIGFCAYELYDEAHFEPDSTFHKEAHFGLIDKDGNKKDTYNLFRDLYGGTGVVAARTVSAAPAAPANIEQTISAAGVSTTFAATYISTPNRLSVDFRSNPLDLSEVSQFEFDLYIEDYDAFLLTNPGRSGGTRINFAFSSTDTKTEKRARFDIIDQITHSGWNHIVLRVGERWQVDSGLSYSSIKWLMIFFQDGGSDYNPVAGMKVAIANVYATTDAIDIIPDYPDYDIIEVSKEGKKKSWGDKYNYTGDRIYIDLSSNPVDLSAADKLEFDIFIRDYDAFVSGIAVKALRFYVASGSSRSGNRRVFDFKDQVSQDGWNHIVIDRSVYYSTDSCDFTSIKWVGLAFWNGADEAIPIGSTEVRIANICGSFKPISIAPAYPSNAAVELTRTGKKGTWGAKYNYTADNMYTATVGTVDMSAVDQIEFDIYIEDLAAFQSAMYPKNPRFYVASGSSKNDSRSAYAYYTQIVQDGWNHVVLDKASTTSANSADFSSIKWVGLADWSGSTSSNPIGSTQVRFANVCGTYSEISSEPDYPDYAIVQVSKEGKRKTWGDKYHYTNDRVYLDLSAAPADMSAVELIEFDIYIKDYSAFISAVDGKELRFYVASGSSRNDNRRVYNFPVAQVTGSGWNHIIIDRDSHVSTNSCSFSAIKWIGFYFNQGYDVANPIKNTEVRFANICGSLRMINRLPDWPEYDHVEILKSNTANWWGSSANNSNHIVTGLDETDISATEQVEFDVYVDNYEGLMSATASGAIRFRFGSAGDNYIDVNVRNKITHDGWNHVVAVWLNSGADANTDRYSITGDPVLSAIRWVKLYSSVGISSDACGKTRIANVCFTVKEINRVPEYPSYAAVELTKEGKKGTWGAQYNYTADNIYKATTGGSVDMGTLDQIEFDIYIKDNTAFQSAIVGKALRFYVASGSSRFNNRRTYDFADQITKDGWNHIILGRNNHYSSDSCSFSSLKWVGLAFWNGSGVSNPIGSTQVRIANVCATSSTGLVVPTDVMAEKTASFIGTTAQAVKFDADGYYDVELAAASDISDARMFEMDVFLSTGTLATFEVELIDGNDDSAVYTFGGLTAGWNHLAIRLSDAEGEADLADIVAYSIAGAANASIFVANFYAADYVDGDANRDGVCDILDLIRAKKFSAGTATAGNLVAMDMAGGDYDVDADDLAAMTNALLA